MTKVVVGFLCEGVGKGNRPPKLMRYHLPLACCFCQGCKDRVAERMTKSKNVLSLIMMFIIGIGWPYSVCCTYFDAPSFYQSNHEYLVVTGG